MMPTQFLCLSDAVLHQLSMATAPSLLKHQDAIAVYRWFGGSHLHHYHSQQRSLFLSLLKGQSQF
ncbi:MAG: hypothetical protein KME27_23530 [Lyngbya sp. HA4199-MV5]|nr:hypothetical protein [Lyngbya sp. HA4199-MV5]